MGAAAERLPSVSHRPSAGSKFSIYPSYERHVERTMGVTLRGALRDNCLTIRGGGGLWSVGLTFDLFSSLWVTFCSSAQHASNASVQTASAVVFKIMKQRGGQRMQVYMCFFNLLLRGGGGGAFSGPVAGVPGTCFTGPFHMWQGPADDLLTWSQCSRPADKSPF